MANSGTRHHQVPSLNFVYPRSPRPLPASQPPLQPNLFFQCGGAIALTVPHPRAAPRTQMCDSLHTEITIPWPGANVVARHNALQLPRHPRSSLRPAQPSPHPPFGHSRACYAVLSYLRCMDSFSVQRDIRYLNFSALRDAGYRGAIFDKDNCLVSTLSPS